MSGGVLPRHQRNGTSGQPSRLHQANGSGATRSGTDGPSVSQVQGLSGAQRVTHERKAVGLFLAYERFPLLRCSQASQASQAQGRALRRALCGDARSLPVDEQHDAVLLLGPLYHLITADNRARAWAEARRCVRPGGVVVAAAVSRFYSCWETLASDKMPLPGVVQALDAQLRTGEYRNPSLDERLWTTAYFHTPDELAAEACAAGLLVRTLVAVEGPAKLLGDIGERMADPERRQHVLDAQRRIEEEPSVLGMSQHILAIAERPEGP